MTKLLAAAASVLASLGLAGFFPPPPLGDEPPPPPKAKFEAGEKGKEKDEPKRKGEPGPAGDLHRAYGLLRRLRADGSTAGRPEERLRDWIERAVKLYRDGVKAFEEGDRRLAHEYGAAAHDLARAVDHARNAARYDRPDPDLPTPPEGPGPEDAGDRVRHDLYRAYGRICEIREDEPVAGASFYLDAAKDLYNAARRDAEAGRLERAGELARAAEAITHVPEHLGHAAVEGPNDQPEPKRLRPEPPPLPDLKRDHVRDRDFGPGDLPPPL
ncbi:MAG: hypothetical protein JO116_17545 [Planctomycetaceae bacterium]|nr:hypothetical protein [Planctomycetaceae bacterium]